VTANIVALRAAHHGFNERIVSHDTIFRTETPSLFATNRNARSDGFR